MIIINNRIKIPFKDASSPRVYVAQFEFQNLEVRSHFCRDIELPDRSPGVVDQLLLDNVTGQRLGSRCQPRIRCRR